MLWNQMTQFFFFFFVIIISTQNAGEKNSVCVVGCVTKLNLNLRRKQVGARDLRMRHVVA